MTRVCWQVLGEVTVELDGVVCALAGRRQRAVLAYLILRGDRIVTADQLVDALWDDDPPRTARNSVQRFVADLRGSLGEESDRLETVDTGYRLRVEGSEVDLVEAEVAIRAGRDAAIGGHPAMAARSFRDALARWAGRPLEGVGDAAYAESERIRIEELRLGAVEDRLAADLDLGRHGELIDELGGLIITHPYRERLWGHLMLALYRCGRQAEALATYQRVRKMLLTELGVEPSPDLQQLEGQILEQSSAIAVGATASVETDRARGYELHELVREDTHAKMHRATQPGLEREVAVKVVSGQVANRPEFIRRFDRRAQRVAQLEHPHIVPLHDYWREPDRAYLVMRWLRGSSLSSRLEHEGRLPMAQVSTLLRQIGGALEAAHRAGVVHGHVSPATILFDEQGNAYLTEFDVAFGDGGEDVDPAVDVHALAVTIQAALPDDASPSVDDVLGNATAGEPNQRYQTVEELVDDYLHAVDQPDLSATETGLVENPYRGLRAFQESDAEVFFGRAEAIDRLVRRLGRDRFVSVIGPSGSGKSSLVRAGLVPAVHRGALPSSRDWFVVDMIPGHAPFDELSTALRRVAVDAPTRLFEQLATDEHGLRRAVDYVLPDEDAELVLVIDQFEELFTLVRSERVRARFIDSLVAAVTSTRSRLRVVVTMRADFFNRPLEYHGLGELVRAGTETVTALSPDELEQAIALPAERVGVEFERGLIAEIVADVANQPASLPLLQYALTELFDQREATLVTMHGYDAIGGVLGALAGRATDLLAEFDPPTQEVVRQVFLRLVTIADNSEDTRRRVLRSELSALSDPAVVEQVIESFGRSRLLSLDHDPASREPTVEVAHEALIREWTRLSAWVEDSRDELRVHRQVTQASREWGAADHDPSFLLTGSRLDHVELWRQTTKLTLTADEAAFIAAGSVDRRAAEAAERARAEREADLERRSVRRLRVLVGVLAVAAVVAGALTLLAARSSREAADQRDAAAVLAEEATIQSLISSASAQLENDPEVAMLLAIEAADLSLADGDSVPPAVADVLHDAFSSFRLIRSFAPASVATFDPTGELVVTGGPDNNARIFNASDGALLTELVGHLAPVTTVDVSPDGARIVTGSADGSARVWDTPSGLGLVSLIGHDDEITRALVSPDGRSVATGSLDGTVRLWDSETGDELTSAAVGRPGSSVDIQWSSDGSRLWVASLPLLAQRDVPTLELVAESIVNVEESFCAAAASPTGDAFVVGPFEGARLISDAGGQSTELIGHSAAVCEVAFSPDGSLIATGSDDATARIWDRTGTPVASLLGHGGGVSSVTFDPAGTQLLTASFDGEARLWDIRHPTGGERFTASPDLPFQLPRDIEFGRGGETVLVAPRRTGLGDVAAFYDLDASLEPRWENVSLAPAAIGPGGSVLATPVGSGERVGFIDPRTGSVGEVWASVGAEIVTLAYDGAGSTLVAGDRSGRVLFWDGAANAPSLVVETGGSDVVSVSISADGRRAVAGSTDGDIYSIDRDGGAASQVLEPRIPDIGGVATSPDGAMAAAGGRDGVIRLWESSTNQMVAELNAGADILAVTFSPDGELLATASANGVAIVWDVDSGTRIVELGPAPLQATSVSGVAFSPDGTELATVDVAGLVQIRLLDPEALVDLARARVTRPLSLEECERYVPGPGCS